MLKENNQSINPLKKELELINLYIDIEESRFGNKLIYKEDVKDDCLQAKVPSLLLLPLLENSVKHGVQNSTIPVTIIMKGEKTSGQLILSVENNYDPEFKSSGTGIGLTNIRQRLKMIYKQQSVEVSNTGDHFKVQLTLPFDTDGK